jgi:hypothetical protein
MISIGYINSIQMALTLYPERVINNYLILKELLKQPFKENEPLPRRQKQNNSKFYN